MKNFLPPCACPEFRRRRGGLRRGVKFITCFSPFTANEPKRWLLLLFSLIITIFPQILIYGCNGGGEEGQGKSGAGHKIFVASSGGDKISVFNADDDGDVPPIRTIGSNTGLVRPRAVFVDTVNDEIFVASTGNNTITVYKKGDEGDATPLRSIKGENTGLFRPIGLFLDKQNDEIFVANLFTITVYKRTDEGNVFPVRTIEGENTGLSFPSGIFVDLENEEIFVSNSENDTVTVYERTAQGNISPLRTLFIQESSDTGVHETLGLFVDIDNDELLVVDTVLSDFPSTVPITRPIKSTIKVYRRRAEGNESPLRTIEGENTGLFNPSGVFVDNNEIFAVNSFNNTVTVYGREATGDVPPSRTLSIFDSNNAGFRAFRGMSSSISVDSEDGEMFVANLNDTITIYDRTAEGKTRPLRIIGPHTGLLDPNWIHVNAENNEIFVSNFFSQLITVHGIDDEGNVAPLRTIPQGFLSPQGISVDTKNNEIFVLTNAADTVTVYGRRDSKPIRTIFGTNTGLSSPRGIYVDRENNEIFVTNFGNNTVTVYGRTGEGDVIPIRTIGGDNTGLLGPQGISVDTENDEIFVANFFSITVYDRTAEGDVVPLRVIEGFNAGLGGPTGIFIDPDKNEIFVANFDNNTVTVYSRTAKGDTAPLRTIGGPNTGLSFPFGIFVADSP